ARRQRGVDTRVVILTDGAASHPGHPRLDADRLKQLRRAETLAAVSALSGTDTKVEFLGYPDGQLGRLPREVEEELVARLAGLIREWQPGEIFIPCKQEGSAEHDGGHRYAMSALEGAGVRPRLFEYIVWGWRNPLRLMAAANAAPVIVRCG